MQGAAQPACRGPSIIGAELIPVSRDTFDLWGPSPSLSSSSSSSALASRHPLCRTFNQVRSPEEGREERRHQRLPSPRCESEHCVLFFFLSWVTCCTLRIYRFFIEAKKTKQNKNVQTSFSFHFYFTWGKTHWDQNFFSQATSPWEARARFHKIWTVCKWTLWVSFTIFRVGGADCYFARFSLLF